MEEVLKLFWLRTPHFWSNKNILAHFENKLKNVFKNIFVSILANQI